MRACTTVLRFTGTGKYERNAVKINRKSSRLETIKRSISTYVRRISNFGCCVSNSKVSTEAIVETDNAIVKTRRPSVAIPTWFLRVSWYNSTMTRRYKHQVIGCDAKYTWPYSFVAMGSSPITETLTVSKRM